MKKLAALVSGVIITGTLLFLSVPIPSLEEQVVSCLNRNVSVIIEQSAAADLSGVAGGTAAIPARDSPVMVSGSEGIRQDGSIRVKVKSVVDGDTLRVVYKGEEYKVRLLCIDTPETVKAGVDEQPYGKQATEKLKEMVLDKEVTLVFEKDTHDRYDRLLAYVMLDNGTCVNAYLVENGLARVEIVRPNTVHKSYFNELQDKAISEKKGFWSLPEEKRPFIRDDDGDYIPRYIEDDAA